VTQKEKAEALFALHTDAKLLVLPNIWNPIGARVLQSKGFPAVATASAAISASLGYEDGETIQRTTLIPILGRIARSVKVPVTADIERGYADSLSELENTIHAVLDAGVVGINIEDSLVEGEPLRSQFEQCERLACVRSVALGRDIPLVINARTDSFITRTNRTDAERIDDAVSRAAEYARAGADCVYPIGPGDIDTVTTLRAEIDAAINILVTPNAAPLKTLQDIGVNRVTFGPYVFRSLLGKFAEIADTLQALGDYDCFSDTMLPRDQVSEFLIHDPEPDGH
jgi:2-methylisocitrate lyase-like PEP mutase family enzyme